jgi:hypothetical protein
LVSPNFHARRHLQQVADRRLAVFRALEARHIRLCRIFDGFDRAVANSDPDQHRVIDFAIDCEMSRSRSVRPYW